MFIIPRKSLAVQELVLEQESCLSYKNGDKKDKLQSHLTFKFRL